MARKKRVWIPNRYYHIVCRGNRRDPLFRSSDDFQVFFQILRDIHKKVPFEIASYCLMTNHYHLQMRSQHAPISKVMALLNKRYADYYNTRYCITGHVFEKRFYDKVIEDKEGMLEASRYIHLNPVEAKMVKHPEHYRWSSYYLYQYPKAIPASFMNMDSILKLFIGNDREKKERYCRFVVNRLDGSQSLVEKE